ncbi:hypothetical protein GGI20_000133 [Coemansia sp. BCRC 34301]|nr:hypothetical protein GGI20_000133 [Coemansia sp. BCRC 34301]
MVLSSYETGKLCWAKLKGYPWWPSRIENEATLSREVLDSKPRNNRVYPVLFFGSLDYAWMTPENLEPYDENLAKYGSKAKNRKDPSFADALKQAQEPSIAEALMRRRAGNVSASDDEEEDDVEMQSGESDVQPAVKSKAGGRRGASGGRERQPRVGSKRASLGAVSSDDDEPAATTPKRSRTAAREEREHSTASPSASTRRDSDDSRSATKDSPRSATPEHKQSVGASKDETKGERSTKVHQHSKSKNKSYQTLMQLRHRLQKTIIKGPIPDDLAPVHDVLRKLEEFEMTRELISDTKLGKVMRIIGQSNRLGHAPEEQFGIRRRANILADRWAKQVVHAADGLAELAAPEEKLTRKALGPGHTGEGETKRPAAAGANTTATDPSTHIESGSLQDTPFEAVSPTTNTANLTLGVGTNGSVDAAPSSDAPHAEQQSRAAPAQGIHPI